MVKPKEDVIAQFNDRVNMTAEELESWVDSDTSKKAGTGVGLDSGKKITDILKRNPDKDPEGYEKEDIDHMRKVTGYIGRHLAQEDRLKETKTREELEKTKSTISLKNWGHDPVKAMDDSKASSIAEQRSGPKLQSMDKEQAVKHADEDTIEAETRATGDLKRVKTNSESDQEVEDQLDPEDESESDTRSTQEDAKTGTNVGLKDKERPPKKKVKTHKHKEDLEETQ